MSLLFAYVLVPFTVVPYWVPFVARGWISIGLVGLLGTLALGISSYLYTGCILTIACTPREDAAYFLPITATLMFYTGLLVRSITILDHDKAQYPKGLAFYVFGLLLLLLGLYAAIRF